MVKPQQQKKEKQMSDTDRKEAIKEGWEYIYATDDKKFLLNILEELEGEN